jgi:hypothetical protein
MRSFLALVLFFYSGLAFLLGIFFHLLKDFFR